jgi:lactate dehydrogenase-like 2-hydroxyacid dehydrogenase
MSKPRVLITRQWPKAAQDAVAEAFDVTLNADDKAMTKQQLAEALRSFDAVAPTVSDKLTADVFEGATAKIVTNYGVGYTNIDVEAAKKAGIVVTNTPGVLTDCTADLAMGLMLAAARRIGEGEREVRANGWTGWRPTHMIGTKVTGATLGVIGFGRIGQAVARRAHHGFGMKIIYFDAYPIPAEVAAAVGAEKRDSFEDVLKEADFVTLHTTGGAENRHLINAARLKTMKPNAILVNTARGEVVDEAALAAALKAGTIAGAGLDVFEEEPKIHPDLVACENAVLAPHLGSATMSTRVAMGMTALANLQAFFEGREPPNRVA